MRGLWAGLDGSQSPPTHHADELLCGDLQGAHRVELVTDDAKALREQIEAVTGERISALEGIGEGGAERESRAGRAGIAGPGTAGGARDGAGPGAEELGPRSRIVVGRSRKDSQPYRGWWVRWLAQFDRARRGREGAIGRCRQSLRRYWVASARVIASPRPERRRMSSCDIAEKSVG